MAIITAYSNLGSGLDMTDTDSSIIYPSSSQPSDDAYWDYYDVDTILIGQWFDNYTYNVTAFVSPYYGDIYLIESIYLLDSNSDTMLEAYGINVTFNIYDDFSGGAILTNFLSGNDSIYGNNFNDLVKAGAGIDYIFGYGGNDQLYGEGDSDSIDGGLGTDYLHGGSDYGNDILNGGSGADIMLGGGGSDIYIVSSTGDKVYETTYIGGTTNAGGLDLVKTYVSYALGSYVEKLSLGGTSAINGTGNSLGNTIIGNGGTNILSGLSGSDTLNGGAGNDKLVGGYGKDSLVGGTGNDVFDFNAVGETGVSSTTRDIIAGFVRSQDKIDLSTLDAKVSTTINDAFSFIGSAAFSATNASGQLRYVYSSTTNTGVLYGSTDADTTPEFSIQLNGVSSLASLDFVL